MRRWIRIAIRLLLLFAIIALAIYIFLPSTLFIRESIAIETPQRVVYEKLSNPSYWISRSKYFYSKKQSFTVDSTNSKKPKKYRWKNGNGTEGFIQQKDTKKYESIIYQVNYEPGSEGELTFNLSYDSGATAVTTTLEVELPSSIWKKVKAYLWYIPIKRGIKNELQSLAMDCQLTSKPIKLKIKSENVGDFKAYIKKVYIAKRFEKELIRKLRELYEKVPASTVTGQPYIQYASNPYNDTLIVVMGIPVSKDEIKRVPNTSLALFNGVEVLYATYNFNRTNSDDVYNELVNEARKRGKNADSYPIVSINTRTSKATMRLPITE